jgi:hypothetical protein
MRMYELWKLGTHEHEASRLEDGCGPVLFPRMCDAEEYSRSEADSYKVAYTIVPVQVGLA